MTKEEFNPHKRYQNLSWSLFQIDLLRNQALKDKSATFVIYAALESRIVIERLELAPLDMVASSLEDKSWQKVLASFKGIQRLNSKIKTLQYRYQSFSAAFAEVVVGIDPVEPFDYSKAEKLQSELAQYIHIYNRSDEELNFDNEFIQNGLRLINRTYDFLKNSCALHEDGYVQVTLNFKNLSIEMKDLFNDWVMRIDNNEEALKERMRKIVINKNN